MCHFHNHRHKYANKAGLRGGARNREKGNAISAPFATLFLAFVPGAKIRRVCRSFKSIPYPRPSYRRVSVSLRNTYTFDPGLSA